jgi:hypothetical protein
MQEEWAGAFGWAQVSYPVSAGTHAFKWEYSKDETVSSGQDCAWIDYIVFPSAGMSPLGVFVSANPDEVCEGESSQLNAFAVGGTGNYTYEWLPVEGLSNPNIPNPVATPDETTTYSVAVNDGDNTVNGNVTVTVNPLPETPVVTQQGNLLVSSASDGNQWYKWGGIIPGATGQYFEPLSTDNYYVIVTNEFDCASEPSNVYHFVYTGVIEVAGGQEVNIYPNPFSDRFTLDYSLTGVSNVKITIYNTLGQPILILMDDKSISAGNHRLNFNTGKLENGIYYCKIETDDYSVVKRIIHSN